MYMDMVYVYVYVYDTVFGGFAQGQEWIMNNCNFGQVVAYGLDWIRELVLTQPFLVKDSDDY